MEARAAGRAAAEGRALAAGEAELAVAMRSGRGLVVALAAFSAALNLLMLTGPLFMLQLYDRVVPSGSLPTLTALVLLALFLYLCMVVIDVARGQLAARAAARLRLRLEARVAEAALQRRAEADGGTLPGQAIAALDAIQGCHSSPAWLARFDLPFVPLFLLAILALHPLLLALALAGGALLVLTALANQWASARPLAQAHLGSRLAERQMEILLAEAESLRATGLTEGLLRRWKLLRDQGLSHLLAASDAAALWLGVSRGLRLALQSGMLALAALLVLQGATTAGAMFAASLLLGRALLPFEQLIAHWPSLRMAASGRETLAALLAAAPPAPPRTTLPRPEARLTVRALALCHRAQPATGAALTDAMPAAHPRDAPVLSELSFELDPGRVLAIAGPSGAGKSTLARALVGALTPAGGEVRLGSAPLAHYGGALAQHVGYLPQRCQILDGTVAENIAGLDPRRDDAEVVAAASRAGAHEMILSLPQGYETMLSAPAGGVSGGQLQRIALARALYRRPVLLVLDEPDANLDRDGTLALCAALRTHARAGGVAVVITARAEALSACDLLLVLEGGRQAYLGPIPTALRQPPPPASARGAAA